MFCKKCGTQLNEGSVFCNNCGAKIESEGRQGQMNLLAIAGVVSAFISFLINLWGLVGIVAVILSTIGLAQINRTGEGGKGLAVTGIVIGAFSIVYAFGLLLSII